MMINLLKRYSFQSTETYHAPALCGTKNCDTMKKARAFLYKLPR
jgi:hypothetical protein